jgi:hypothetical protein
MQAGGGGAAAAGGQAGRRYQYTNARRHAIVVARSTERKFPRAEFGTIRVRRTAAGGSPDIAAAYGDTYATADAQQRGLRNQHGFYGRGKYSFGKALRAGLGYTKTAGKIARSIAKTGVQLAADYATGRAFTGGGMYGGQGIYGGQGEYRHNALMEGGDMSMQVHGQNDETDSMTLTNREFVKEIYAPNNSGFNLENIECNPGLPGFAPKLAAIAANYQQYEIKQLVFEIVPLISESNVNNGITGTIMAVWNYDTNTDLYDNKEDIMQSSGAVSGRIVDKLTCGVECDDKKTKETEYFTRTCPVPLGRDADEFDHGKLVVATNNIPAALYNLTIAELYVYYTIELRHFKPGTTRLNGQQRDEFACSVNATEITSPSANFTNQQVLRAQQSNIGGRLTGDNLPADPLFPLVNIQSGWEYTFPAEFNGYVEVRLILENNSNTRTGAVDTVTGNVTRVQDLVPGSSGLGLDPPHSNFVVFGPTSVICVYRIKVRSATAGTDNKIKITLTGGGGQSVTQWGFQVLELSQNMWQSRTNNLPIYINDATKQLAQI